MGTASQQLFVLPLTLTTLRTHNADPTTDDLRTDLEHLCIREVLHWQDPQLEPRLHDPQVQLYHAYMVLSQRSIEDPTLYVFINVLCTVDRSYRFQAPVAGKLSQPYVTPKMDAVFMRYEYSLNWTHHKASVRLTSLRICGFTRFASKVNASCHMRSVYMMATVSGSNKCPEFGAYKSRRKGTFLGKDVFGPGNTRVK